MQGLETLLIGPDRQPDTRWRLLQNADFHWKRWDDVFTLYNSGSGQTHVLDPLAVLLIQLIGEGSRNTSELLQQMVAQLDVDASQEFREKLQETLSQLDALGLIEAVVA
jgi:PqqD family protein of HPr-rel-A system